MKGLLLVVGVLTAQVGWAFPTVGDTVAYKGAIVDGQTVTESALMYEITAYDKDADLYTVRITKDAQVSEGQYDSSQIPGQAALEDLLTNCVANDGVLEDVTVTAGTFTACKLHQEDQTQTQDGWFAVVPFGAVKLEYKDASTDHSEAWELVSYQLGVQ